MLIQAGDKVPADGLLIEGSIKVSQAALNGESREETKVEADSFQEADSTDYNCPVKVFWGSVVTSGEAYMVATVIGGESELGKINASLNDKEAPGAKGHFYAETGKGGGRHWTDRRDSCLRGRSTAGGFNTVSE